MSAITGIFNLDGRPVERPDLNKMNEILAHRGPDGEGIWHKGSVGLGHRMLWTTPESLIEKLPLENRSRGLVITADARIDNRDELINILNLGDRKPGEITDTDLILSAYEKWGEQSPEKLIGDFAFAIWDDLRQRIFCARDHFGVKPFYYYMTDKIFAFASEVKALFCLDEVPCTLNEIRVAEYLASIFDDTANTFYKNILRLSPACFITANRSKAQLVSYWSLDPSRSMRPSSNEEYVEGFREKFSEAVHSRLRSAFPVGSMLSGGLDSSSIACTARKFFVQNSGDRLKTFSAVFDKVPQCDEREFIDSVLALNGFEPSFVHGDEHRCLMELDHVLWHEDEALYAFNLSLNWSIYKSAQKQGVRIMLDGFDGDTTVSHGVGYLVELARTGRWLSLLSETKGFAANFELNPWKFYWDYVWRWGIKNSIPKRLMNAQRLIRQRLTKREQSSGRPTWISLVNPRFARQVGLAERRNVLRKQKGFIGVPGSERDVHFRLLKQGVMPYTLEVINKAAAAFSIEPRFPFWDKRLVEYCLALPPEQKIKGGWSRLILRRAMAGIVPLKVQWRAGKSNLGHNLIHGVRNYERNRLEKLILRRDTIIEKYVDMPYLREAYGRFLYDETGNDAMAVWKATMLAEWLEQTGLF